ncbi:MAG TPA: transcription elongation factor GreA [Pseudomonadota bacterium]|nr:transcription elongation factor GreA [Pseudomonadota bacterium]
MRRGLGSQARITPHCSPTSRYTSGAVPASNDSKSKTPEKNYITPIGFRRLQREFETLRGPTRREVVAKLSEAAAEGDRSENAEYIYRKRQLRQIDSRIRHLIKRMAIAEVIDPSHHKGERVTFGCVVTLEDDNEKMFRYQIVGVDESDPKEGRISYRSPIGRALIGKYVDDAVSVQVAAGTRELTILSLEFPSGEVGESGGETIADAMLAAQQALAESPSVDGDEDAEGSGENAEAEA